MNVITSTGKKIEVIKKICDMSKYGVTGDMRWSGDVIVKTDSSISVHGKYFPTRKQAVEYANKIAKEIR